MVPGGWAREPVEKSRSLLKLSRELLGTSQKVQGLFEGIADQIVGILSFLFFPRPHTPSCR